MKTAVQLGLVIFLVLILIAIRGFIAPLFYDPLHNYFLNDYLYTSIPTIEFGCFYSHLFFRYFLNTIVSLAIIYVVFNNTKLVLFSAKFYVIAFLILGIIFYLIIEFNISDNNMLLFYIRRFLIHPLFVFILLPAFYYQKIKEPN